MKYKYVWKTNSVRSRRESNSVKPAELPFRIAYKVNRILNPPRQLNLAATHTKATMTPMNADPAEMREKFVENRNYEQQGSGTTYRTLPRGGIEELNPCYFDIP